MKKLLPLIALVTLTSACTWVKVNDDGKQVAVTNQTNVANCEQLRTVSVKVTASVGPLDRGAEKVATELATMARNEAMNFGGDTVAALGPVKDGAQDFGVYRCK